MIINTSDENIQFSNCGVFFKVQKGTVNTTFMSHNPVTYQILTFLLVPHFLKK